MRCRQCWAWRLCSTALLASQAHKAESHLALSAPLDWAERHSAGWTGQAAHIMHLYYREWPGGKMHIDWQRERESEWGVCVGEQDRGQKEAESENEWRGLAWERGTKAKGTGGILPLQGWRQRLTALSQRKNRHSFRLLELVFTGFYFNVFIYLCQYWIWLERTYWDVFSQLYNLGFSAFDRTTQNWPPPAQRPKDLKLCTFHHLKWEQPK